MITCAFCLRVSAFPIRPQPVCQSRARPSPRWSTAHSPWKKARGSTFWRPSCGGRKGEYKKELQELQKKGFQRVKVDGVFHEVDSVPALDKKFKHDLDVVVDRIVVKADMASRLADSYETALKLADGIAVAEFADKPLHASQTSEEGANKSKNETHERVIFSERFACPVSGFTIEEIEPRLFSFNNPHGACPACDGLGTELKFEADLVVPDTTLSLRDGAIAPWSKTGATSPYYAQTLEALCKFFKVSMTTPWRDLPKKARDGILNGTGEDEITFTYDDGLRVYKTKKTFEGVIGNIERRWRETDSEWMREELAKYQSDYPCHVCLGMRLKPQALAVKIDKLHIGEVSQFSIRQAEAWYRSLDEKLSPKQKGNCCAHSEGNPGTPALPRRCGSGLPLAVAGLRHIVRW